MYFNICIYIYLANVVLNGVTYQLMEIEKPSKGNYVQLETIKNDKFFAKVIYLVVPGPQNNLIKIGRGHDSDVKIADISVSRVHAHLNISSTEGLVLQDNSSKFGTLLLMKSGSHEIDPTNGLSVQISRTTFNLTVKKHDIGQLAIGKGNRIGAHCKNENEGTSSEEMYIQMILI